ncbi:DUF929 family protein [Gryllotalpicola reticulitermitis]|uniref:DUF929 family protein n=1 Tax=Gryllotalpicola reticulitermitis TaxID=1184153 RepID=A0ABV8Q3C8_9MICO
MARTARVSSRRRILLQIIVGVVVLVVAVAVAIGVSLGTRSTTNSAHSATPAAPTTAASDVIGKVTGVPASVFDAVGPGTAQAAPSKIDAPALTQNGKPLITYIGGEFCPYCAAERWPLAVALSRFGTLSGLGEATSAPSPEVYPSTSTLSFHGATLTSDYLALDAKEIFDEQHNPLDKLTTSENALLTKYDAPPYTQSTGSIPFVDIGGAWVLSGAQYDPGVLKGLSQAQIAADLADPGSAVAKSVIGTANVLTVGLCQQTAGKPATVCQSAGVKAAAAAMGVK